MNLICFQCLQYEAFDGNSCIHCIQPFYRMGASGSIFIPCVLISIELINAEKEN